jgi:hypothetical protein
MQYAGIQHLTHVYSTMSEPLKNHRVLALLTISLFLFATSSCNSDQSSPWDDPLGSYVDYINKYHESSIGSMSSTKSGNQSVYIDFSDGLVQAYKKETNNRVIDYLTQKLVGSSVDWYGLGKNHNGIGRLNFENDRDIYNKVISQTSYNDIMSPIEEALKKITSESNDAIIITDFEEYTPDGKEQKFNYAKQYFTSWIQKGNSITLYYSSYTETNSKSNLTGQKNLYFAIFNYGAVDENSLLTKFDLAIADQTLPELKRFDINASPFRISNNYKGKNYSGLTPDDASVKDLELGNAAEVILHYMNGFYESGSPYEVIEVTLNPSDFYKAYFSEKKRFARNLFLDASQSITYQIKMIKTELVDVTEDFKFFVRSEVARDNKPNLIKDEGNNRVWDEGSTSNIVITTCYDENTENLKPDCSYTYSNPTSIQEIFDIEKDIFQDHLKNTPEAVELITVFHNNYDPDNADLIPGRLYRLDLRIESTEAIYSEQLDDFKWNSIINRANGVNESLYQSIRNTIQDVTPKGRIYSYYIKF